MFNYLSFGYVPVGKFSRDLRGRWRGAPILFKRLQAKTLMDFLAVQPGERLLDFGCGGGFFTYECARAGAAAVGVDLVPLPEGRFGVGKGEARFVTVVKGRPLPFEDGAFDKVLVSEVFVTLDNPEAVCAELYRVLRPGGRVIVVNTLGRLQIEDAYRRNTRMIAIAKRLWQTSPRTYAEFCERFFRADGLQRARWFTANELEGFLAQAGFVSVSRSAPFRGAAFGLLYWMQFARLCRLPRISLQFGLVRYLLLEGLNQICRPTDVSAIVLTGDKA